MFIEFSLTIRFEHDKYSHLKGLSYHGLVFDLKNIQSNDLLNIY